MEYDQAQQYEFHHAENKWAVVKAAPLLKREEKAFQFQTGYPQRKRIDCSTALSNRIKWTIDENAIIEEYPVSGAEMFQLH